LQGLKKNYCSPKRFLLAEGVPLAVLLKCLGLKKNSPPPVRKLLMHLAQVLKPPAEPEQTLVLDLFQQKPPPLRQKHQKGRFLING